jgi:hypothetical protein
LFFRVRPLLQPQLVAFAGDRQDHRWMLILPGVRIKDFGVYFRDCALRY